MIYDVVDSTASHISNEIKLVDTIDVKQVLWNQEGQRNIQLKVGKKIDPNEDGFQQEVFIKTIKLFNTEEIELFLTNG